jgi:hypothetical protein
MSGSWYLSTDPINPLPRRICNNILVPTEIPESVYNYKEYTPVVLTPISKSSVLVLGEYSDNGKIGLKVHDIRIVNNDVVSSVTFQLRGDQYHIGKFKNEMNRACDEHRCVGISYFLRKLYNVGFSTIYVPKILHRKENSSLRSAVNIVTTIMNDEEI